MPAVYQRRRLTALPIHGSRQSGHSRLCSAGCGLRAFGQAAAESLPRPGEPYRLPCHGEPERISAIAALLIHILAIPGALRLRNRYCFQLRWSRGLDGAGRSRVRGKEQWIPHLAKRANYPDFMYERQATSTCAAFIEESRMKFINANKLHGKSGVWGTRPW